MASTGAVTGKLPPVKPRGIEAIKLNREIFIEMLRQERDRQQARTDEAARRHQQESVKVLERALADARKGRFPKQSKYDGPYVQLPRVPTFNPCSYDQVIARLEADTRDEIVLHSHEWDSLFPCDVKQA